MYLGAWMVEWVWMACGVWRVAVYLTVDSQPATFQLINSILQLLGLTSPVQVYGPKRLATQTHTKEQEQGNHLA